MAGALLQNGQPIPVPSGKRVAPLPVTDEFRSERYQIRNLVLLITEQCNLRCDYCYIRKVPRTMSRTTAQQAVDFLFRNDSDGDAPLSITFFGGEPLLEPELIEFIHQQASERAASESREISFGMTTNATLLNAGNVELLKRLKIGVRISLDGVGEAHDLHRPTIEGKSSFALIQANMQHIAELDNLSVRLTVSPETAGQLDTAVEWLLEQGFHNICFSPVTEAEWDENSLSDLFESLPRLYRVQEENKNANISHIGKMERTMCSSGPRWGCGAARTFAAVDAAGFLYPCHRFVGYFRNGAAQRIGHVSTGFDTAQREYYIVANHSSSRAGCGHGLFPRNSMEDPTCKSCALVSLCGSNCMAVNEYMTGDPTRPAAVNRLLAQIEASVHLQANAGSPDSAVPATNGGSHDRQ